MDKIRKPYQGALNIVKFNWHFYVLSFCTLIASFFANSFLSNNIFFLFLALAILVTTLVSLLVSHYIYDLSNLYLFNWIEDDETKIEILNINAGFDETSILLQSKYKNSRLTVFDFYNPKKHTEVSINRARKAYPPYPNTKSINTSNLVLHDNSVDKVFVILAAHEIRNQEERIIFFTEIKRVLKNDGQLIVIEHLRDFNNFIAYNIGFFHFLSKQTWLNTFKKSNLQLMKEQKITPFISTFILTNNGNTY
jgi:ubiquinone/menaquinone biosynthesis C-methylase UbiE